MLAAALVSVTCLISTSPIDLHFDLDADNQIQSAEFFNSNEGAYHPISVGSQSVTDNKINFSGHDDNNQLVNVEITMDNSFAIGPASIQIGDAVESTSCFISRW